MYKIAIIGLGYVGSPLAQLFAGKYSVIGFDIDKNRIGELLYTEDKTLLPINKTMRKDYKNLDSSVKNGCHLTSNLDDIRHCNIYIITVPTPVDEYNKPDLSPLLRASENVGYVIKKGDIVIYESTVYPGATEEDCIPVIEKASGLKFNQDFYAGYSPERVNPGDSWYTIEKIKKVTSGSTPQVAKIIDDLYSSVIPAGTYMASSIKVAEASKVIENTQRDVNIAFINEMKKVLDILNIDTTEVLAAASTKWNFMNLKPGLVGGHCISVDPYYLVQRAQQAGYNPELTLTARQVNNSMGNYVVHQVIDKMRSVGCQFEQAKVLILGFSFKANCSDIRNTKVIDIYTALTDSNISVEIYDPLVENIKVRAQYNVELSTQLFLKTYDVIILAVKHHFFEDLDLRSYLSKKGFVYSLQNNELMSSYDIEASHV